MFLKYSPFNTKLSKPKPSQRLNILAAKTTFGDNGNNDEEKVRKAKKRNEIARANISSLNSLFYKEINTLSGEELYSMVQKKFGRLYTIEVCTNEKMFRVRNQETDPLNLFHFNKIAETINHMGDPHHVRKMIENMDITCHNKDIVMEFSFVQE
jgi:hypothetical protein